MPTETEGAVVIKGRFGLLQVATDAMDTVVPVAAGAVKVNFYNACDQRILYSLTGGVNSWKPLEPTKHKEFNRYTAVVPGGTVNIYLRKARQIRQVSVHEGADSAWAGWIDPKEGLADDCVGKVVVTFE